MDSELCKLVLRGAGIVVSGDASVSYTEEDSPGLGYSSLIQRFRIYHHKDESLPVIVKSNPDLQHHPDSLFDPMFQCEIKMFQNVFPLYAEIFERSNNSIIWPKLYAISKTDQIVIQDLKPMKFETNVVESGSSLEEASLAITSLAKFHAAAIVAKSQGKMSDDALLPYFYCRSDETINSFFKDGLRILVATIRQSWGDPWSALANKLETVTSQIGEIFVTLHKETDDKFKVVNHGDFWRSNLMYTYDQNKSPNSFKCVDFQLSHYGSIGWDLSYFLFLNPNLNLRYSHYDDLICAYQRTLADFLESCDCPTPALSVDDINRELDRFSVYGFLKCCTDLPYHICSFKTGIDAENLFKNNEETDKLKMKLYSSEKYICIIKTHIGHLKMANLL